MAHEVIDLVSDSDDDISPSKAATSTLQAFGARKEKAVSKNASSNITRTPNEPHPHARPPASKPAYFTTTGSQDLPPNASLADLLRYGTPSATVSRNAAPPSTAPPLQRANYARVTPKTSKNQRTSGPPRTSGPLYEERLKRFQAFHGKESERKGDSLQRSGLGVNTQARAGDNPLSSTQPSNAAHPSSAGAPLHPKRGPSTLAKGFMPAAKRCKNDDSDTVEVTNGMQEARRLSAAAINPLLGPTGREQKPLPTLKRDSALNSKGPLHSSTALNNSSSIDDPPKSTVIEGTLSHPVNLEDSREPSPDEIPAKPQSSVSKPRVNLEENRESSPDAIPAKPQTSVSIPPVNLEENGESSPDSIPAESQPSASKTRAVSHQSHDMQDRELSLDDVPARDPYSKSFESLFKGLENTLGSLVLQTKNMSPSMGQKVRLGPHQNHGTQAMHQNKASQADQALPPSMVSASKASSGPRKSGPTGNFGSRYTAEEDERLISLKEVSKINWEAMPDYFSGRTQGSLQVRYSTIKNRKRTTNKPNAYDLPDPAFQNAPLAPTHLTADQTEYTAPARRLPRAATNKNNEFVSWADLKKARKRSHMTNVASASDSDNPMTDAPPLTQHPPLLRGLDVALPSPVNRILRLREIGGSGGRSWSSKARLKISDELQNHVIDTLGPRRYFHGTPRDVTSLAWANDGNRFAAGAIALDDESSMQYNGPNNLLLGDVKRNSLVELPEHHVPRPIVTNSQNVNSLHSMRETQDPRLFKTVAAVEFSGNALFSAGADGVVRMYDANMGVCLSSYQQGAEVSLIANNANGLLASACHRSDDASISALSYDADVLSPVCTLGPSRADVQSSLPIFPSALKWGSGIYSHLLLGGFASDSFDEGRLTAGEVFLWDSTAGLKIDLPTVRGVFDVAWNPSPSSSSSLFAIAGTHMGKRLRSSIQCFAPNQSRASRVLQWDCPAFDINDVIYCPHDDNLIAAGATDGKVYLWDKRFADRTQRPLHILSHGPTKNVLDHTLDREIADSGVRFLSWSATGNRLYSGSSDGTVKIWNPYRTTEDALVKDVATFNSAIISGAFSPDYRDLLIGEEQGQINLLGIDREGRSVRAAKKFDLYQATIPKEDDVDDNFAPARELLDRREIEIKPMGLLPVKQAVQGPNYCGPYLNVSDENIAQLVSQRDYALNRMDASRISEHHNIEAEKAFKATAAEYKHLDDAIKKANTNRCDYKLLEPLASAHQKRMREARHARKKDMVTSAMKRCRIDCNYLPAIGDEDGEAPDDQRSHQRIPGNLRTQHSPLHTSDMTNVEIEEAGLTSKCCTCMGPASKPKRGRLPKCEKCTLVQSGLTARCENCAVPVRPSVEGQSASKNICERCEFHCFRCGHPSTISPSVEFVECHPCGAVWEAGVLGYELKSFAKRPELGSGKSAEPVMESLDQRVGRLFGDEERERLARGWRVGLLDGMIEL